MDDVTCSTCGQPIGFDMWSEDGNRWFHPGTLAEPHHAAPATTR